LLQLADRPTAIVAANDLTAIGALRIVHQHGLSVPDDISIIGFDDIEMCNFVSPPLTTLHLSQNEMANTVVTALEALANSPQRNGLQYNVETTLVVRNSTGTVRKKSNLQRGSARRGTRAPGRK
jgi:DNA-binding LacI/PurR family transcriptional regulator